MVGASGGCWGDADHCLARDVQGPAKSSGLVELLGADGVREFAQATGMTHHAAMTMLASTQMLEQTYGVIGGDLDPTANMAKADKYMIGEHEAAKLMVHIKGGDVTADNAETLFTDQGNDGTTTGSGSLCGCDPSLPLPPLPALSHRRFDPP